ncbi:MAG: HTH-type transcriptional repressor YtrA [Spirochaetes bacterium ADurb.Bin215]|jgi:GntR family transcriptional regulator|nr:MAG: HTH-type transcriptional repressor YtrA [Spirochaetes bacterium ADurb.Bin215]
MPKIPEFTLDTASGVPFYRQIIRRIADAVLAGTLPPGTRLPTIRSLAIQLKINPNTIAKAYAELELRGIVTTQVGSGTFISENTPEPAQAERDTLLQNLLRRTVLEFAALGIQKDEIPAVLAKYEEDL